MLQMSGRIMGITRAESPNTPTHTKSMPWQMYPSMMLSFALVLYLMPFSVAYADQVDKAIIPMTSFGKITCANGIGNTMMTGYYTNGDIAYKVIFLKMILYDKNGNMLFTGYGNISDINPHVTKIFHAISRFSGNFTSCAIQVDSAIPR